MAIYEYECPACSHRFEMRGGYENARSSGCPKCKGEAFRIFSPVAIKFADSYNTTGNVPTYDSCDISSMGYG